MRQTENQRPSYKNVQPVWHYLRRTLHNQFLAKAEIHSISLSEPIISGSYFTVKLNMSFTHADRGEVNMEELCVYHVKGGKIVSQQFFIG